MNAFDDNDPLRELFGDENRRTKNVRFSSNRRNDGNALRFSRSVVSRQKRRKHTLRRALILLLLLLMFFTSAFGALPANPVRECFLS
jgi:hypothetical protein